jgi:hypothetical protein
MGKWKMKKIVLHFKPKIETNLGFHYVIVVHEDELFLGIGTFHARERQARERHWVSE